MTPLQDRQRRFATYLWKGFPDKKLPGWSMAGAAAVTGNATMENQCLPITMGTKDHGSDGILQWRLARLRNMKSWCIKEFGIWSNLEAQAAFTLYETAKDLPGLDHDLRAGKLGVRALAEEFCRQFERPNMLLAHVAQRQDAAEATLALLKEVQNGGNGH